MKRIAVLSYNVKHRKTYDTLCLLTAKGYKDVTVYAQPMTYAKKRYPLINHRPEQILSIPETADLCRNLGFQYVEGNFAETVAYKEDVMLLCGAGLLPGDFVSSHRIINAHPGYIPLARGLDAYKWSIYCGLPIGVTTHLLGEYIDAGEILERREIIVTKYDTFHSVAQRIYENEIDMLVGGINHINGEHEFVYPQDSHYFGRMDEKKEMQLYSKFEEYKMIHGC